MLNKRKQVEFSDPFLYFLVVCRYKDSGANGSNAVLHLLWERQRHDFQKDKNSLELEASTYLGEHKRKADELVM